MPKSTITSKGQTTIPIEVRKFLGVREGDMVDYIYEERKGTVTIKAQRRKLHIRDLAGILYHPKRQPLSEEEVERRFALALAKKFKPRKKP